MALKLAERKAFAIALERVMRGQGNLKPAELAAAAGCTPGYVKMLLAAQANPSAGMFFRLAHVLGVPSDRLLPEPAQARLHGWTPQYRGDGTAEPKAVTLCHAESRMVRNSHATEADRLDAELTYRRLAGRLAAALAVAEDTIEALRPKKGRLPEWGLELLAVGDALRDAGVTAVELHEAAGELDRGMRCQCPH